jgi:two-component system, OmpR family, KDP operon response regulator KdpE
MTVAIRILIVDDEPQIQRFLKLGLEAGGFAVSAAATAADAIKAIAQSAPDLVLLDLGLPDLDGKDVIRQARAFSRVPIIIVSARDREAEKIEALDLGADDYVNKPFGIGELLARIRTALRHHKPGGNAASVLSHGGITVDVPNHRVTKNGASLKLTPKEFDLLALLMRNAGRVMTHGRSSPPSGDRHMPRTCNICACSSASCAASSKTIKPIRVSSRPSPASDIGSRWRSR